jgi:hypothetical protein
MKPNVKLISIGVLALAVACPFATIGLLALIARSRKRNLRSVLPWLRALRWTSWLAGLPFAFAALVSHRLFFCFPIGMGLISASIGLSIAEQWVKRRYAPELLLPQDEWWPTHRE